MAPCPWPHTSWEARRYSYGNAKRVPTDMTLQETLPGRARGVENYEQGARGRQGVRAGSKDEGSERGEPAISHGSSIDARTAEGGG